LNFPKADGYRLPYSSEWIFAAKGGNKSLCYRFSGSNHIEEVAWYEDNSRKKIHQVMKKKPNELGLYDMCGNVWEWCNDGGESKSVVAVRGGSFESHLYNLDITNNQSIEYPYDKVHERNGFRIIRTVSTESGKVNTVSRTENSEAIEQLLKTVSDSLNKDFVYFTGDDINPFYISKHQVTQKEFISTMGINPSVITSKNNQVIKIFGKDTDTSDFPVDNVSWLDAIYYCNKRSINEGLEPVYGIGEPEKTNPLLWGYEPCTGQKIDKYFYCNHKANGYRLPSMNEWIYAANSGSYNAEFAYSGSNNYEDVACFFKNSGRIPHPVMTKNPNKAGLYDMSGNVGEWCWDKHIYHKALEPEYYPRILMGGCSTSGKDTDFMNEYVYEYPDEQELPWQGYFGFRVVRSAY